MSLLTTVATAGTAVALAAGAVGIAVLGSAGPASAGTASWAVSSSSAVSSLAVSSSSGVSAPSSSSVLASGALADADKDGGLDRACARVPAAVARVQRVQTRFGADANTRGSIAFLEARIAKATSAGKTDLAQLLTDRLAIRKDLAGILPDRLKQLQDAREICARHAAKETSPAPVPAPSASPA